ncbi:hypothetical protein M5K25_009841 [Dendrobium thyrsiflorum]|uniref:Uncharacterized protein n=1 Tax=Dendrobium thyrsiflorum TaxID=117978 RepID=A0ABD0VDL0_DENTH
MAELFVGPIMQKIINACSDYLEGQVGWQTGMKKELERLRENHPKIQAVVFAANQAQISDQNPALNRWIWQLRDAIDEADDVLDEFEYMKHKQQLTKNTEETKKREFKSPLFGIPLRTLKIQELTKNTEETEKRKFPSFIPEIPSKILKIGDSGLKRDPNLKRLEEAVQKLDKVSADVTTFLHLLDGAKQEQKAQDVDFYKARETGSLPKNDLIGRGKDKEFVMQWLRKPSNDPRTTWYRNISLLSIVGHGGMGRTTLLQHIYEDEMTKEFDLKMWVCVSNNFDAKEVIADMLEYIDKKKPDLDSLDALQGRLQIAVRRKKFLLILDDIWVEEVNRDISKWENVLAPLAYGKIGSRILVTTQMDSFAMMIATVIKKKTEIFRLEGLETGYLPKNDLIGRRKEKELVMEWLRKPSNEHRGTDLYRNISLLSIVGHGGMGKTTLLQHVYEDEITMEFDLKMWVCVSNNFDAKKVIAVMLECLENERPRLETLGVLQRRLEEEVMSKKFLLVLDDIWEEKEEKDKSKWEDVLAPLASGSFGSKIMLTTRMDAVAQMFAKVIKTKTEIVKLNGLEEDECLQLLNSHAFAGVENPSYGHKKLMAIAGEIVKKLLGSPLAAKVIGGVLKDNLDEGHWRTVLESNLLGQNSINSILKLSYIVMPNHLQNCFAFCCMFPQDHTFDKDDLVRMWIALGFIQLSQGMTTEDNGGRYFDVLLKKNLFDKVGDDYKMHDLIHESASKFFAQECGKLMDDEESSLKISETIRHLSVLNAKPDILKKIEKFKHLHSLFLFYKSSNQDNCSALTEIFKALRSLRLLSIWTPRDLGMIPKEIGNLIHLRYLRIDSYNLTMLPRSLSNLYHLQYIIHDAWMPTQLEVHDFLPSDINNLSNLRYMKLPKNCILSICGIGKLKFFLELNMFNVRDVSGYRIGELENMNDLCKLGINCLENVKVSEEACSAKLYAKRRLTDLTLCWSNTCSEDNIDFDDSDDSDENDFDVLHENVLDNLQPPECLINLSINNYRGARSPIWMNKINPISNLEKIELTDCLECETLPPFGQLPFLKLLTLRNMPKVKWLESKFNANDKYHAFPSLEKLRIEILKALEDWFEAGVAAEDGCLFPCLIQLDLFKCPKLKELPSLPPKLKILKITNMDWKTLNFCSNSNPIPLERLEVFRCRNITSLPLADEIARLAALRNLTITDCPNLRSLGNYPEVGTSNNCHLMLSDLDISDPLVLLMEPLRSIDSLKKLSIKYNDELVSFPNEAEQWFLKVRSSLSELHFAFLKSLESLPSSLESLSSLQKLSIHDVPMLRELPNLPPSLKYLSIWRCHPELKKRYGEDGGSDRHKVAHIPHIYF